MTRINCGIPVKELSNKHLIAEHREIKRVPNAVRSGRVNLESIPEKFTLGTGHVRFFYDKLLYLKNRYMELYKECRRRGFNVTNFIDSWNNLPERLLNNYEPTEEDKEIVRKRINERLRGI